VLGFFFAHITQSLPLFPKQQSETNFCYVKNAEVSLMQSQLMKETRKVTQHQKVLFLVMDTQSVTLSQMTSKV
jgi:hypothetical protein